MRKGKKGKSSPGRQPRRLLGEDRPPAYLFDVDALPEDVAPRDPEPSLGRSPRSGSRRGPDSFDDEAIRHGRYELEQQLWKLAGDDRTEGQRRASDLIHEAWLEEHERPRRAQRLAQQALAADPDCADALVLLARLESESPKELVKRVGHALTVAERALGKELFREAKGQFWGVLETRPYMRTRQYLAGLLQEDGRSDEAIRHLEAMLDLNEDDNLGVRYTLLGLYLERRRLPKARDLLRRFPDECMATWAWGKVIERHLSGDLPGAETALEQAIEVNPFVLQLVADPVRLLDLEPPAAYTLGSEEEAAIAAVQLMKALLAHPATLGWLLEQCLLRLPEPSEDPRDDVEEHWLARYDEIVALTDAYCHAHLDDEYRDLAREMTMLLCQDGTPGRSGKAAGWAAGVIAALVWVNIVETDQGPLTQKLIGEAFGVSVSTVAKRLSELRDGLGLQWLDPEWTVASGLAANPMVWLHEVNGLVIDLRFAPRELQEQAFADGLIPWIPADQEGPDA